MSEYRVVALDQQTAETVRTSLRAPGYGHPAHVEVASGYGPCRACLRQFRQGQEERVLFTYNPFPEEATPGPGPVFIHKEPCARYDAAGFPAGLAGIPLLGEGYDAGGFPVARVPLHGDPDRSLSALLAHRQVAYVHVRNAEAGCFIARVERS